MGILGSGHNRHDTEVGEIERVVGPDVAEAVPPVTSLPFTATAWPVTIMDKPDGPVIFSVVLLSL